MLSLHECVGNQKQKALKASTIDVKRRKISLEFGKIYLEEKCDVVEM